ncbi:MAG: hypothetical protein OXE83_13200 [Gammaproteobacteria bacterium]|nr:hypothetical protein [Gammaproteobacteria bacterium]
MATLLEYRELPLADLLIDKGQVRTRNVDKEVDALAEPRTWCGVTSPARS